ncbi:MULTISPECIES: LacI family DNA-binding transcriptional regulator [unclassified Leifsonia]|uniref:LacI family DNA-binding transcriptional regulator n=1 Tax=unclassified Leifsonia TaxID=2663824 RepID=UPI0006F1D37D|nr:MULTISPECIES: LacI family DNA-binding transcriptional regulator [unclassified Leifsonia]KQX08215.1 LacI family transcriptional regulator [Leifsonia sp. Root1293]KRA12497.1 LacI family transcriptional regulator [Leifsonia sp. Root60]
MSSHPTNGRREVTVTEVAAAARVSKATAARALGGYGAVSEAVRDRVLLAADELGYRPNALAKSMNTGRSNTIGLVVGDIENPFFAHATRGAWDVARAAGYDLIVSNSDEEMGAESDAIGVLLDKRVDGILVSPASSIETQTLQTVLDVGRPLVLFDRCAPALDVDAVVADNEAGAFELATLLLAAGHRRIAFISTIAHDGDYRRGDELASTSVGDRVAGLLRAVDASQAPDPVIRLNARRDGIDAVTRSVLTGADRATAIIASDSLVALAVFLTIRELGLEVPRDVSLVSFDDADWTGITTPAITVMAQPIYEVGAEAARMLLRRIAGDRSPAEQVRLPQSLLERASVAPPLD